MSQTCSEQNVRIEKWLSSQKYILWFLLTDDQVPAIDQPGWDQLLGNPISRIWGQRQRHNLDLAFSPERLITQWEQRLWFPDLGQTWTQIGCRWVPSLGSWVSGRGWWERWRWPQLDPVAERFSFSSLYFLLPFSSCLLFQRSMPSECFINKNWRGVREVGG